MIEKKPSFSGNRLVVASGLLLLGIGAAMLARKLWTDQNSHDPGITELEALDYSIDDFDAGSRKKWKRRKD